MADEKDPQPLLSEVMKRYHERPDKLESLFTFLRQRMLDMNEADALSILNAIQTSDRRDDLGLQDFGHALHRQSLYEQQGNNSLPLPTLEPTIADVQLNVDSPVTNMPIEVALMYAFIEWAKQQTGHNYSIKDGEEDPIHVDSEPILQIKENNPDPDGRVVLNQDSLDALARVDETTATYLTSGEIYTRVDGQQAINKMLIIELINSSSIEIARLKLREKLPDHPGFKRDFLCEADRNRVDGRLTFYTIAEAVDVFLFLRERHLLRTELPMNDSHPENNGGVKPELRDLDPNVALLLSENIYTLKEGGILVVPKGLVTQMIIANDAQDASLKMNYHFGLMPRYTHKDLIDEQSENVDRRMRFYTLTDAVSIVSFLVENGLFRPDYSTPHPQPVKTSGGDTPPESDQHPPEVPAPEDEPVDQVDFPPVEPTEKSAQDPISEPEVLAENPDPTIYDEGQEVHEVLQDGGTHNETTNGHFHAAAIPLISVATTPRFHEGQQPVSERMEIQPSNGSVHPSRERVVFTGGHDREDRIQEELVLEPIRNEVATLMTMNSWLFGANNQWLKGKLFPLISMVGSNQFYVSVYDIHTQILGGYLTDLFDPSYKDKCIAGEALGIIDHSKSGKYLPLEDALRYIYAGYKNPDVKLKCDD